MIGLKVALFVYFSGCKIVSSSIAVIHCSLNHNVGVFKAWIFLQLTWE